MQAETSPTYASRMHFANHADSAVRTIARLRLDGDLDILSERGQQAHQALAREVRKTSIEKRRHLRLINSHQRCRRNLGQSPALDNLPDVARKLGLVSSSSGCVSPISAKTLPTLAVTGISACRFLAIVGNPRQLIPGRGRGLGSWLQRLEVCEQVETLRTVQVFKSGQGPVSGHGPLGKGPGHHPLDQRFRKILDWIAKVKRAE